MASSYERPSLQRLGSLRELTQFGGPEWLFGVHRGLGRGVGRGFRQGGDILTSTTTISDRGSN